MIVCHAHKFIFIKTRKTAGTSVEIALSKYCGPDDIITRITPGDEKIRAELGYRGPQKDRYPLSSYQPKDWGYLLTRGKRPKLYNHLPAAEARQRLGDEIWNSYFKFTIERNPWDRAVSLYYWRTRDAKARPSFTQYLTDTAPDQLSNFDVYAIDGAVAMDHVIRFEQLSSDLARVAERLGLPGTTELPNAKGGVRKDKRPYRESYGDQEREIIARACSREIAHFGYEF